MISWHKVGQKVVCKVTLTKAQMCGDECPEEGGVYTIREVIMCGPQLGFRFAEIHNAPKPWGDGFRESAFWHRMFEPVYPQRLDALRGLLEPTPDERLRVFGEMVEDELRMLSAELFR